MGCKFTQRDAAELARIEAFLASLDEGLDSAGPHERARAVVQRMGIRNQRIRRDYLLRKSGNQNAIDDPVLVT